ncbi:hypothetical protein [Nocardioides sp. B-3]|uniref:hypothetical protein n=1 Tax=Nocardioides sp. B-3 TaxID=2895565 RepID=UPI00215278C9|nr:hypothetical protein [Nocardioides sp. B-3]UUZ59873.1 hypothetical protein LP418_02145 [Nocardioides sp. B-3]
MPLKIQLLRDPILLDPVPGRYGPMIDPVELGAQKLTVIYEDARPRDYDDLARIATHYRLDRIIEVADERQFRPLDRPTIGATLRQVARMQGRRHPRGMRTPRVGRLLRLRRRPHRHRRPGPRQQPADAVQPPVAPRTDKQTRTGGRRIYPGHGCAAAVSAPTIPEPARLAIWTQCAPAQLTIAIATGLR